MNFSIKEKLIDFNDSLIKAIDFFLFIPGNKLLVFGNDKKIDKQNKFQLLFEVWDISKNYVINEGKMDTFAISYLCKFSYYKENYVVNIKSINGQRLLFMFDILNGTQKVIFSDLKFEELQSSGHSLKTELFCFQNSMKIIFYEIFYMKESLLFKKEIDEYYLLIFIVIEEQDGVAKVQTKLKIRRERNENNKIDNFKILKGNEKDLLIILDYNLNEIMFWYFGKELSDVKYFYMNFGDFKFLKSIENNDCIQFLIRIKSYKYIKLLKIDTIGNRCLVNDIFSSEGNSKDLDLSKIIENKVFFFKKYTNLFVFNMIKLQSSFDKTYYFLFEYKENSLENFMSSNSSFQMRLFYEKKKIFNYFFKQKECFNDLVCLTKKNLHDNTLSLSSNENDNSLIMRVFSFTSQHYDNLYEKLKIFFFYFMKNKKKYDNNTIELIYKMIFVEK